MTAKKQHWTLTVFLIIVVCANLLNVTSARADGETPTEPPAPTQIETEPPVESTPEPVQAQATPVADVLSEVPEGTEVIVLDENGDAVPLASEEAAGIAQVVDPIWCPEGVMPGGAGCSASYDSISQLINNMVSNTAFYTQNGVIYFTTNPGAGTFNLSPTTLTTDFDTLKNYNLTLQGGWNGSLVTPALSGQTDFANRAIVIGDSGNPWVGNVTLKDIAFCADIVGTCNTINQTALTVYTSNGNITLNNVDVYDQAAGNNTALLSTSAGSITVTDGTFDGNDSNSSGFLATAANGSITINNTFFQQNKKSGPSNNSTGATLQAPVVTLNNVTATNNDSNGIMIHGANTVSLVNVLANGNGTDVTPAGFTGNFGSGLFITGNPGANIFVTGGAFNNNQRYGIEVEDPASISIYMSPSTQCTGNDSNAAFGTCSNDTVVVDNSAPVIAPNISGTLGLNGWYTSDVTVNWSVTDGESGVSSSTGCTASNLTAGTTLTCSATNKVGLSNSTSLTIKIDKNAPTLALPSNITVQSATPTPVNYSASATDDLDSSVPVTCTPASGSTFSLGPKAVDCFATDDAGNTSLGSFLVTVQDTTVVVTPTAPAPTSPAPTSTGSTSESLTSESSNSQTNSPQFVIPLTGGEVIHLNCSSSFWAFGIKLSFTNLCDYQTILKNLDANNLPGSLPDGSTLVTGLDVQILSENQAVDHLPAGSSIQLDFPISGAASEFAVLFWNGSEWTEVSPQADSAQGFYQVITTDQTGSFVLVKK